MSADIITLPVVRIERDCQLPRVSDPSLERRELTLSIEATPEAWLVLERLTKTWDCPLDEVVSVCLFSYMKSQGVA